MSLEFPLTSPLPQRFISDAPGIGGAIKQRPEDFLVEELPLYDPSGEGEHLYLGIQKSGVSHSEMMATLRKAFRVTDRMIGYAGMKDKHGVTRQTVSIHLPGDDRDVPDLGHARIAVTWAMRHRNKIRRGHLAGNRFSIRVRDVDPTRAPHALRTLRALQQTGAPAYFGQQRFGYRGNNHLIGAMLLTQRWAEVVHEIAGTGYTPFPEYQRPRRELADRGEYENALQQWTVADRAERIVLRALCRSADAKAACLAIDRTMRSFYISAYQSAIFNRVLDHRLDAGTFEALLVGDLAWKHDTRNVFPVTEVELATGELPDRLARFEISPSGPLWGAMRMRTFGEVARREQRAFESIGVTQEQFDRSPAAPEGERRPLRTPITNLEVEGGVDEHGGYIRVAFDLPRGSYATVVLRELMKTDLHEDEADSDEQSHLEAGARQTVV